MVDDMKIIERAVMPNGTKIQLEDWNNSGYPELYKFTMI